MTVWFLRELAHQRTPHVARLAEAVQQQHRIALPHYQVVQPDAVRFGELALDRRLRLLRPNEAWTQNPRDQQREYQI